MLFNSFSYFLFLPTVLLIYWALPVRLRKPFLLIASYFFYMTWKPIYGLLILALTAINYTFGLIIAGQDREKAPQKARAALILGLIFNLGALCYFKYTNFLFESLFGLLGYFVQSTHTFVGAFEQPVFRILLPLGISFFSFEFIHYIVDVYRGSKPVKNFVDFALFASFFPSQIAGPIKRFQDFMQQMHECPPFKGENFRAGIYLILQGLVKKVVLGDNISPIVARGFASAGELALVDAWISVIGFSFQLYFDFSGYTDIGRGSALLLGYKVPENFNLPFLAGNLSDFWRRWHISLSSWLRDYLFIPLGGSRRSEFVTCRNLFITMLLGGLWHGAAWHFVVWGAFHGGGLTVLRQWQKLTKPLEKAKATLLWHIAGVICTNLFVYLAFAVFRAANMKQASMIVGHFFGYATSATFGEITTLVLRSPLVVAAPLYFLFFLMRLAAQKWPLETRPVLAGWLAFWDASWTARAITYATVFAGVVGFAPSQFTPFIYFQF
jgi:alginate O-acetyltransferase complex protein AlgI